MPGLQGYLGWTGGMARVWTGLGRKGNLTWVYWWNVTGVDWVGPEG